MSAAIVLLLRGGANAPLTTMTWQWQVSPDGLTGWLNASGPGAGTAIYTPVLTDAGQWLRVRQTATDDGGATTATSNAVQVPLPVVVFVDLALVSSDFAVAAVKPVDQHARLETVSSVSVELAAVTAVDGRRSAATLAVADHRV